MCFGWRIIEHTVTCQIYSHENPHNCHHYKDKLFAPSFDMWCPISDSVFTKVVISKHSTCKENRFGKIEWWTTTCEMYLRDWETDSFKSEAAAAPPPVKRRCCVEGGLKFSRVRWKPTNTCCYNLLPRPTLPFGRKSRASCKFFF